MIPAETVLGGASVDWTKRVSLRVLGTPAGYYIGYEVDGHHYSRESRYYASPEEADDVIQDWLKAADRVMQAESAVLDTLEALKIARRYGWLQGVR
jgi:hypothetical protein